MPSLNRVRRAMEMDRYYRKVYEMEFEKFVELLKLARIYGLAREFKDDFRILLRDLKSWREAKRVIASPNVS